MTDVTIGKGNLDGRGMYAARDFKKGEMIATDAGKDDTDECNMSAHDVVDLYNQWDKLGLMVWIDGGWGVDALLGKQMREHSDLDIALDQQDVAKLVEFLRGRGYQEVKRESEWNFVLGDHEGRQVDIHAFICNDNGHIIGGVQYPDESLTGTGIINGYKVRCISPEYMVTFHSGYALRESDYQDVSALCKKFNIPIPDEYAQVKMVPGDEAL
ncbi:MAG TPA: aminoglycoside nucleotidyltransferase [Patescibacteria group bacterium]|nr:aminoglycoside nucleotidyltransferase [Patescibacteria group bacterium]